MTAEAPRLPHPDVAIIHDRKLVDYLLAPEHPFGQAKARFFEGLGFSRGAVAVLRRALLDHARMNPVATSVETSFGTKYVVEGPFETPSGRRIGVRAVWFVERGEETAVRDRIPVERRQHVIKELDLVVLTHDLPEEGLEAGDVGTVVLEHDGGRGLEVEFMTLTGETLAVVTVPRDAVRTVGDREIAHVREVA